MIKKISAFLLLFGLAFFIFLKRPQDKKVIESKTVGKSIGNYAFDPNGMRLTIDVITKTKPSKERIYYRTSGATKVIMSGVL